MVGEIKREFQDFEIVAQPFLESFFMENLDVIEYESGVVLNDSELNDLKKLYVLYEYLSHKSKQGKSLNENELIHILYLAQRPDYAKVLKDYCLNCGKITRRDYNVSYLVNDMVTYSIKKSKTNLNAKKMDNKKDFAVKVL